MYKSFFKLKMNPFILTPDPEFLYISDVHDTALAHLEYGILHKVGFVLFTGEVGSGKTTLLKYLVKKLDPSLDLAMVFNTNIDSVSFLEMITKEFDIPVTARTKSEYVESLFQHFVKRYSQGQRCVIVVDEAQNLPGETFEELRMLSNFEVDNEFLVQIILVGQPELQARLLHPSLKQLSQRISVHFHLLPLQRSEVRHYIEHRLKVAGHEVQGEPLFHPEAVELIGETSRGIPRLVNSICDASLVYAYADSLPQVGRETVEKVISDNVLLSGGNTSGRPVEDPDPPSHDPQVSVFAEELFSAKSGLQTVTQRLNAIETRLGVLESGKDRNLADAFQGLLAKERDRSHSLEQRICSISVKYKQLEAELERARAIIEFRERKKRHASLWRFFGFKVS